MDRRGEPLQMLAAGAGTLWATVSFSVTVSHGKDRHFFPRTHIYFETRRETTE